MEGRFMHNSVFEATSGNRRQRRCGAADVHQTPINRPELAGRALLVPKRRDCQ